MTGLVRSLAQSWSWIANLYRGPIVKMDGLPRRRLEMVPPPVTPRSLLAAELHERAEEIDGSSSEPDKSG